MTFTELIDELQKVKAEETRGRTESSLEVVISKDSLAKVIPILEDYFGPALKPQGQQPNADSDRYSKPYGGVHSDQTLYFRKEDKGFAIAMLWPWGNGVSITLRVIRERSEEAVTQPPPKSFLGKIFGK